MSAHVFDEQFDSQISCSMLQRHQNRRPFRPRLFHRQDL